MRHLRLFRLFPVLAAALACGGQPEERAVDGVALRVLSTTVLAAVIDELGPAFERESGIRLSVEFGNSATLTRRLREGEEADLILVSSAGVAGLARDGRVKGNTVAEIGQSFVGIAVRRGAPRPDIGSPDALRSALVAARSVAYTDPASGGASSVHFQSVIRELGIDSLVQSKARLSAGGLQGLAAHLVASGEAELAVQQIAELVMVPGVDIVGALPERFQSVLTLAGAVVEPSEHAESAAAFIKYLQRESSVEVLRAKGIEPVR